MPHISKIPQILDQQMEQIARAWARNKPLEFRAVMDEADAIRSSLYNENGMSVDRLCLVKRTLNNRLEGVMNRIYGTNWINDPDVLQAFDRCFKKLIINHTSVPKITGDGPTFRDGVPDEHPEDEVVEEILAERK